MSDTAMNAVDAAPRVTGIATNNKALFQPQNDWILISQGAEARIWKIPPSVTTIGTVDSNNFNQHEQPTMIAKERFSKSYRHPVLDEKLTKSRCRAEGRILEKCRLPKDATLAMDVPKVIRTEPPVLYLEFVEGMTVRDYLEEQLLTDHDNNGDNAHNNNDKQLEQLAQQMGNMVSKLHTLGCVHGDLTTSNMMLRNTQQPIHQEPSNKRAKTNGTTPLLNITLIDFGLAKSTTSAEERAVDLYVLERALTSTHPKLPDYFLETLLKAYQPEPQKSAEATLQRLEQVRLRGRKRECFG
jgi:TP53 regulating kinase and related kinases